MKTSIPIILLCFALITACSGPSRDTELESAISNLVEADEIVAMNNFGQIVINISSQAPFKMKQKVRMELAERLAYTVHKIHPDSNIIAIGFARNKPEIQQIVYSWENKDGKLTLMSQ